VRTSYAPVINGTYKNLPITINIKVGKLIAEYDAQKAGKGHTDNKEKANSAVEKDKENICPDQTCRCGP
jgi:hypothetical protein